jgi:CRISPR/Cas system-associated exonuclease Cas4 (RecB family)
MTPFLKIVAQDLISKYGDKVCDITLVFPSNRAGLFFNSYLSNLIAKPIWAPKSITINRLMQDVSGIKIDDPISLVTNLYNTFCKVKGIREPFEDFYFWGEVMLADFDQVDKYLIDPKQLYSNIKNLKDIDKQFGGLTPEQADAIRDYLGAMSEAHISDLRDKYLSVWEILLDIYVDFRTEIESNGLAYEGLAYRKAAEILMDPDSAPNLPAKIAFIGFNALNKCEKALFKRCKKEGKTLFYWDYDPSFMEKDEQEAGLFIRQNLLDFPNAIPLESLDSSLNTRIVKLIAAPSAVAQVKILPKIIEKLTLQGGKLDETTAIVFPKENLLIPALKTFPPEVSSLNITMGYPMKETAAYSLAELLVKLQLSARTSREKAISFYHRDVVAILNHPYIRICEPENTTTLVTSIKRGNRIYPNANDLWKSVFLKRIFEIQNNHQQLTNYLIDICKNAAKTIAAIAVEKDNAHQRIDIEFLYSLHKSLNRVNGVLKKVDFAVSPRVFLQILRKVFAQERVSFSGEPLEGLQVMGFLETRALDFENLVILSFNDDVLPGKNHPVSFITPSLRVAFGLPDYKHHDAVYAYYFYRLLTRAKNVYLVYSNRAEGLSNGEKSRFGLQLEMEHMIGQIETIPVGYNISLTPNQPIEIHKTTDVLNNLIGNLSKKNGEITLSPSGLTTYLTCPLRFYFRYVNGLDEDDDVTEEVGALEFGRIIHKTMEDLYKEFNGVMVTPQMIKSLIANKKFVENTLDSVFLEVFLNDTNANIDDLSGRNLLARNALLYTLNKMLQVDLKRAPFFLVSHEQQVYTYIALNDKPVERIKIGGIVDRIELNNDTVWSIDYKTGKHTNKGRFEMLEDLFNPDKVDKCKEVFQTFCYSLALSELYPTNPIKPALWFVKATKSADDFTIKHLQNKKLHPVDDFRMYRQEFNERLAGLVSQIFDKSVPFTQTNDSDKCRNCPFVGICGRD